MLRSGCALSLNIKRGRRCLKYEMGMRVGTTRGRWQQPHSNIDNGAAMVGSNSLGPGKLDSTQCSHSVLLRNDHYMVTAVHIARRPLRGTSPRSTGGIAHRSFSVLTTICTTDRPPSEWYNAAAASFKLYQCGGSGGVEGRRARSHAALKRERRRTKTRHRREMGARRLQCLPVVTRGRD